MKRMYTNSVKFSTFKKHFYRNNFSLPLLLIFMVAHLLVCSVVFPMKQHTRNGTRTMLLTLTVRYRNSVEYRKLMTAVSNCSSWISRKRDVPVKPDWFPTAQSIVFTRMQQLRQLLIRGTTTNEIYAAGYYSN